VIQTQALRSGAQRVQNAIAFAAAARAAAWCFSFVGNNLDCARYFARAMQKLNASEITMSGCEA
jgi:cysteine sulfinate desulfinase/cysteine desulfurase-like protein